ncbi:tetratricopeptide repeat protein [uncultured Desulfobacter sp.]|uniref:tetratricopeptide repeat protein n=1 Tax=uncultured Desulfobacter sp. TaxID=240139 RepID=UPI002AAB097E|nr:tetratricopeptide repeat protein [uncultured Desulfobacter sp.]
MNHAGKVITVSPDHAGARFYKARCLLAKGKADLPGQDIFRVAAGFKTAELWERRLAKDELLEALKIDPAFTNARLLFIDILLQDKEILPARNHLAIILKQDPHNLQALIFLGKLKLLEEDFDEAEKIYQAVLERLPNFSSGYVSLGLAFTGMKKMIRQLQLLTRHFPSIQNRWKPCSLGLNDMQLLTRHFPSIQNRWKPCIIKSAFICNGNRWIVLLNPVKAIEENFHLTLLPWASLT